MLFPFNPFYAGYGNRVNVLNHYLFCDSENVLNLKNFIDFVGCLGVQGCGNPNLQDIYNQSTRRTKVRSNAILSIFVSLKPPVYLYYWTLTSVQIHLQKKKNYYCSLFFLTGTLSKASLLIWFSRHLFLAFTKLSQTPSTTISHIGGLNLFCPMRLKHPSSSHHIRIRKMAQTTLSVVVRKTTLRLAPTRALVKFYFLAS